MGFFSVTCGGFWGSKICAFVLTLPLIVFVVAPIFFLYGIGTLNLLGALVLLPYIVWLGLGVLFPFRWIFLKLPLYEE